jgi:hypothetical protein
VVKIIQRIHRGGAENAELRVVDQEMPSLRPLCLRGEEEFGNITAEARRKNVSMKC